MSELVDIFFCNFSLSISRDCQKMHIPHLLRDLHPLIRSGDIASRAKDERFGVRYDEMYIIQCNALFGYPVQASTSSQAVNSRTWYCGQPLRSRMPPGFFAAQKMHSHSLCQPFRLHQTAEIFLWTHTARTRNPYD